MLCMVSTLALSRDGILCIFPGDWSEEFNFSLEQKDKEQGNSGTAV